jgi:RNA polymerase sigma factor (sigma-70 family)
MKAAERAVDWSRAYEQYRPDILDFLRRRLWGKQELAEDMLQETFRRAMKAGTPIRDPSKVRAYLYRTAHHLVIGHLRKRRWVESERDLGPSVKLDRHTDESVADPLEVSQVGEFRERMDRSVEGLPEDQQIAFRQGVLERVPYGEIAREQGWTMAKVKSCVFRARKTLMQELADFR